MMVSMVSAHVRTPVLRVVAAGLIYAPVHTVAWEQSTYHVMTAAAGCFVTITEGFPWHYKTAHISES